jgi:hypothetical protein
MQLRRRGATRLMCTTFRLSFAMERGIVATLTPEIKETFGGPEMEPEDIWKLYLGRTVRLDPTDIDGSEFIEGLLEDILFFSAAHYQQRNKNWQTKRSIYQRNVWVTQPTFNLDYEDEVMLSDGESSDNESLTWDEVDQLLDRGELDDLTLDQPFVEYGPTLHRDEYEVTDVEDLESDDDGDSDVADLGYGINARYEDANWSDGDDDGLYGSNIDDDATRQGINATSLVDANTDRKPEWLQTIHGPFNAAAPEDEDSAAGSDFDSDEVLSGDEEVLKIGRTRAHGGLIFSCLSIVQHPCYSICRHLAV